eukprot:455456_1
MKAVISTIVFFTTIAFASEIDLNFDITFDASKPFIAPDSKWEQSTFHKIRKLYTNESLLTPPPTYHPSSKYPTEYPTNNPSEMSTKLPTMNPTTTSPTKIPTEMPINTPTKMPTTTPTTNPTMKPTKKPTSTPTQSDDMLLTEYMEQNEFPSQRIKIYTQNQPAFPLAIKFESELIRKQTNDLTIIPWIDTQIYKKMNLPSRQVLYFPGQKLRRVVTYYDEIDAAFDMLQAFPQLFTKHKLNISVVDGIKFVETIKILSDLNNTIFRDTYDLLHKKYIMHNNATLIQTQIMDIMCNANKPFTRKSKRKIFFIPESFSDPSAIILLVDCFHLFMLKLIEMKQNNLLHAIESCILTRKKYDEFQCIAETQKHEFYAALSNIIQMIKSLHLNIKGNITNNSK